MIREATEADARYVAQRLREADTEEVRALGFSAKDAVMLSFAGSDDRFVGIVDGEAAMVFGVTAPLYGGAASVWALGTPKCNEVPVAMVKCGRQIVSAFLQKYGYLENYCAADYEKSLRWLKLIGFTIDDPESRGLNGELFCKLSIGNKE